MHIRLRNPKLFQFTILHLIYHHEQTQPLSSNFFRSKTISKLYAMKTFEEIFLEWHKEFPFLKKYSPSTIYQKVGPFLLGLKINKPWGNNYRIYLEIMPLWLTERKKFGSVFVSDELWDKKGRQIIINYRHHDLDFKEALEDAKRQFGLVLMSEIPLNNLIEYIESTSERELGFKHLKQLGKSLIFELELAIAVYLNKKEMYDDVWESIIKDSSKWDAEYFHKWTKLTIDEWKESMHSRFDNRDKFMETVEWNYQRPRVAKLNTAHITRVDEYTEYIPKLSWRERLRSFFSK